MKTCTKCNVEKPLTEFYTRQSQCKPCKKKQDREYQRGKGKEVMQRAVRKWQNEKQGVYGIFSKNLCLYIGESKRIKGRISDHKTWIRQPNKAPIQKYLYPLLTQHDNIEIRIIEECDNHKEREIHYINKYKPLYNEK